MKHPKLLRTLAVVAAAQIPTFSVTNAETTVQNPSSPTLSEDNPFAHESALPYHLPPFDQIKDTDFMPAIETGMREQLRRISVVLNEN